MRSLVSTVWTCETVLVVEELLNAVHQEVEFSLLFFRMGPRDKWALVIQMRENVPTDQILTNVQAGLVASVWEPLLTDPTFLKVQPKERCPVEIALGVLLAAMQLPCDTDVVGRPFPRGLGAQRIPLGAGQRQEHLVQVVEAHWLQGHKQLGGRQQPVPAPHEREDGSPGGLIQEGVDEVHTRGAGGPEHDCLLGEHGSPPSEALALDGVRVVGTAVDHQPENALVAIGDEVAPSLGFVFIDRHLLFGGHAMHVAVRGPHHDGKLAQNHREFCLCPKQFTGGFCTACRHESIVLKPIVHPHDLIPRLVCHILCKVQHLPGTPLGHGLNCHSACHPPRIIAATSTGLLRGH
mmetsp:Transcript_49378/g.88199  ORF Transcript_49378/g.88199 Transcript_49378/m.88199 type:complete len:350 (+) Transcript_49378:4163-5212(+)